MLVSEAGRELLTPRAEWRGFKDTGKDLKYTMRCTKCGSTFDSIIRKGRMSPCPICERKVSTTTDTYNLFLQQLVEHDLTPLFTRDDWKGLSSYVHGAQSGPRFYPVKCNKCGFEFEARIVLGRTSAGVNPCPHCEVDMNTPRGNYERFRSDCIKQNLTPLFDFDGWHGIHKRMGGKLIRQFYPVRCNLCNAEYEACRTHYGEVTMCNCQRTDHVYRSKRERYFEQWLSDKGFNVISCDRISLKGQELDLYLPEQHIAFEINGMLFHSTSSLNPSPKPRLYHRDKTSAALSIGIKLYHIWEDTPDELVKSILESKLGILPIRYYARKLTLREVPPQQAIEFFNRCHVDGAAYFARASYGLYTVDGTLQCCLSLMQRRTQATGVSKWEIGRFATELHTHVAGGYSRLLKHAIQQLREHTDCTELVSYCNRDLSPDADQTFYAKNGFKLIGDSGPIYWYWAQNPIELNGRVYEGRIPRQVVQKGLLLKHFANNGISLPDSPTEYSLAEALGIAPVYNSGNFKFVYPITGEPIEALDERVDSEASNETPVYKMRADTIVSRSEKVRRAKSAARVAKFAAWVEKNPEKASAIVQSDYERLQSGELTFHTKISVNCPKHGVYSLPASDYFTNVRACPRCGLETMGRERMAKARAEKPIPDYVFKRMEGSKDLEAVRSGLVRLGDKVEIICKKHGYKTAVMLSALVASPNFIGCPRCRSEHRRKRFVQYTL